MNNQDLISRTETAVATLQETGELPARIEVGELVMDLEYSSEFVETVTALTPEVVYGTLLVHFRTLPEGSDDIDTLLASPSYGSDEENFDDPTVSMGVMVVRQRRSDSLSIVTEVDKTSFEPTGEVRVDLDRGFGEFPDFFKG
jgi:hypothetical protein